MADFCWDCVEAKLGADPHLNDLRRPDDPPAYYWDLCEGCGYGYFDIEGRRKQDGHDSSNPKFHIGGTHDSP